MLLDAVLVGDGLALPVVKPEYTAYWPAPAPIAILRSQRREYRAGEKCLHEPQ